VGFDPRRNIYAPSCSNRVLTYNKGYQDWLHEKRQQNSGWKPQHKLSQVDPETMTGICSVCGVIKVYQRGVNLGYVCAVKQQEFQSRRRRRQPRRTFKSSVAMLTLEREHTQMIDAHKVEHGCRSCGYSDDAEELQLHFRDLDENEFLESKLVHFTRKRLVHALKVSEVYCGSCHLLVHSETEGSHTMTLYAIVYF
jgi:hypothetical protein